MLWLVNTIRKTLKDTKILCLNSEDRWHGVCLGESEQDDRYRERDNSQGALNLFSPWFFAECTRICE